ncbi:MAG: NifU family protein [Proteobacteria bacterium]|nr:NifU family protein [Pseudomonadota bacterium]
MFIETEQTPNPRSLKFIPDRPVIEKGTVHFTDSGKAEASPLAQALFALKEVTGVLLAPSFISVTIKGNDWKEAKPAILGVLMDHFTSGKPAILETAVKEPEPKKDSEEDNEIVQQIRTILDEKVRPAVAKDGGDVIFSKFEDGIVYLVMQGACSGCPSSIYTLKSGIENLLKYYIPDVQEVRQI